MASSSSSSSTILAAEAELQQGFETLKVLQKHPSVPIFHLLLNRPSRRNSLSSPFFSDLPRALSLLSLLPSARALILSSIGPHFSSGIDLTLLRSLPSSPPLLRSRILALQSSLSALERFPMPVIAAVRGACIGAGVDLVAACDIRLCSEDAFFVVKEVDLALAADLGSLQRLPRIIGYGNAVELALTGRRLSASEAKAMGLVSRVFDSPSALEEGADCLARELAEKSSVAVMGTKAVLLKSRDQKVDEGLDYVATWNSAMLMSPDLEEAVAAQLQKRKPNFSKL